jgi:hypothetical protein
MRVHAAVVALVASLPLSANAAELTRIASSFEPDDPFGMYLSVGYVREQQKAEILREFPQAGDLQEVSEQRYLAVDNRLELTLQLGLWQDLEFRYRLPVVFSFSQQWDHALGTTAENSTVTNNCLQANGMLLDPNCPASGAGARPLYEVPNSSYRTGLGNMHFGLAYALFNERKDPSKPMWIVGADYEAPTATLWDPTQLTSEESPGSIGDKIHRYTFFTSFSKRLGPADPYFKLSYTLPVRAPGWYSNCDNPDPSRMGAPENCGTAAWSRRETGIRPAHRGGVIFGVELNAHENPAAHQKVVLDLRGMADYVSEGRYYNELTDVLGKLLYTEDHLRVGGSLGATAWAAQYLGISGRATLLYTTEHTLTNEQIGRDLDGDDVVDLGNTAELNPNFDHRTDMVGRRFRLSESFTFRLEATATFRF